MSREQRWLQHVANTNNDPEIADGADRCSRYVLQLEKEKRAADSALRDTVIDLCSAFAESLGLPLPHFAGPKDVQEGIERLKRERDNATKRWEEMNR